MSARITGDDRTSARRRNESRLSRAVLLAVLAGFAIDAVIIVLASAVGGDGAAPSALVGTGLAAIVTLPTVISARLMAQRDVLSAALILAGMWLVKMLALIIVLLLVRDLGFMAPPWAGGALLGGAVVAAVTEVLLLARRRAELETDIP